MTANANGYFSAPEYYAPFGTPPGPTAENPPVLPPLDPNLVNPPQVPGLADTSGSMGHQSIAQFLGNNPRLPATGTYTFGGSVTPGDMIALSVNCPILPNGIVTLSTLAAPSGDTLALIAQRLTNAMNSNAVLQAFGISATYALVSSNPTISLNWPGPCGNFATLSEVVHNYSETALLGGSETDGDTLTLTITGGLSAQNATLLLGGTETDGDTWTLTFTSALLAGGAVVLTGTTSGSESLATLAAAINTAIGTASASLAPLGLTTNVVGAEIFLAWTSAASQLRVDAGFSRAAGTTATVAFQAGNPPSALAPSPAPSETITVGNHTTGDVISLTLSADTAMSPFTIQYAVVSGDSSNTLLATHLAAALNANSQFANAGFVATSALAVVTVSWPFPLGTVGFLAVVVGTPTETATVVNAPGAVSVTHTTSGSESLATIASALNTLLNANVLLAQVGIFATVSSQTVSIFYNNSVGAPLVTKALSPGASETITLAAGSTSATETVALVNPTGGSGAVIPTADFTASQAIPAAGTAVSGSLPTVDSGSVQYFYVGKPVLLDYDTLNNFITAGLPVS